MLGRAAFKGDIEGNCIKELQYQANQVNHHVNESSVELHCHTSNFTGETKSEIYPDASIPQPHHSLNADLTYSNKLNCL